MARRRKKSKTDVVQVNPDATLNYVTGVLTGGSRYINGLLEGANMYNAWVLQESSLEGKELLPYKEGALRRVLQEIKESNPAQYYLAITNPQAFIKSLGPNLEDFLRNTNYYRLVQTDKYMIEAGKTYRQLYPSLLKSRSVQTGLTFLQTAINHPVESSAALGKFFKSKEELK